MTNEDASFCVQYKNMKFLYTVACVQYKIVKFFDAISDFAKFSS